METTGTTVVDNTAASPTGVAPRLAELVVHLSDCDPKLAVAAVNAAVGDTPPVTADAKLGVVADALVAVRRRIDLRDAPPSGPAGR